MPGPRDDVRSALGRATELAGTDLLRQPRRLRAILADLVGEPGAEHRAEVEAIVAAAALGEGRPPPDGAAAVAALSKEGVPAELAQWALATVGGHGVGPGVAAARSRARPRRRLAISLVSAAGVVLTMVLPRLLDGGGGAGGGGADDRDSTSTAPASTSTSTSQPGEESTGWRVEFVDATEGGFHVSRIWQLSEGRLTATVTLTPLAESGTLQHRELVPAEAFADPVFSPEPDNRTADVAVFNVDAASGGAATVTIEADLAVAEPDEAQVQSWIDLWRERVVQLRPLDDDPPATATIVPVT